MKESKFQFKIPKLMELKFRKNEDYSGNEKDLKIKVSTNVDRKEIEASVTLNIKIFDEEDFENYPYYINIIMQGDFKWEKDLNDEQIEDLLNKNAPAILLSYMRPYFSDITTGSGYPPLILPLLNFND